MHRIKVLRYNIQQHSNQVHNLVEKYLIPTYYKRLGISETERSTYMDFEDCLDPGYTQNQKFQDASYIAIEESGRIIACTMNYFVPKQTFQKVFIDSQKSVSEDNTLPDTVRKYFRHRYDVCHDLMKPLYEDHKLDTVLYLESGIVIPEYRRLKLTNKILSKIYARFGADYGIFCEGMIPNKHVLSGEVNPKFIVPGVDGLDVIKSLLS
eukprot:TCONS_00010850-protein